MLIAAAGWPYVSFKFSEHHIIYEPNRKNHQPTLTYSHQLPPLFANSEITILLKVLMKTISFYFKSHFHATFSIFLYTPIGKFS